MGLTLKMVTGMAALAEWLWRDAPAVDVDAVLRRGAVPLLDIVPCPEVSAHELYTLLHTYKRLGFVHRMLTPPAEHCKVWRSADSDSMQLTPDVRRVVCLSPAACPPRILVTESVTVYASWSKVPLEYWKGVHVFYSYQP